MVELEVFNSDYGDKVEPVVSCEEKGDWTYTLNSIPLKSFESYTPYAFNSQKVGEVYKTIYFVFKFKNE